MFPTKEYIDLCIEHQKELREEWEKRGPKWGDYLIRMPFQDIVILDDYGDKVARVYDPRPKTEYQWVHHYELIPLFRPDQLIEMLKERSYGWSIDKLEKVCQVTLFGQQETMLVFHGPDPATALLRAWLEVVEDDGA